MREIDNLENLQSKEVFNIKLSITFKVLGPGKNWDLTKKLECGSCMTAFVQLQA